MPVDHRPGDIKINDDASVVGHGVILPCAWVGASCEGRRRPSLVA
jgi:hypothetical protein